MKALLFINGEPPEKFPNLVDYDFFACTDGAFHYLKSKNFPLEKLDFISGDFDSHSGSDEMVYQGKFIHTPNQEKTDFHKALDLLIEKGVTKVDVLGGSGGEMDHFLGNLTVAYRFKTELDITFYDNFSKYFFIPNHYELENVNGKLISLYPFPSVENLFTNGLNWELTNENLDMRVDLATRNFATKDVVLIDYQKGDLLIFIGEKYL